MEKERKNKKIILIILLVAVIGLTIGFAAFTTQLKIQSSAKVSPDPTNFKVVFSSSSTASVDGSPVYGGKAEGGTFGKDATTISGLSAKFTAPGQTATWKFYAFNAGEYEAFLNKVMLGAISCIPDGADATKVAEAEKGISIKISVGGKEFVSTNETINSHNLEKKAGEEVLVTLTYAEGSAAVDGNFDVSIGDITLEYNSAD
jgi:hypothetical protein